MSLSSDMFDSTLQEKVKKTDCNLSSDYDKYQMNYDDKNLNEYLSTQESLCTECRLDNEKSVSLFSFKSSCFSSVMKKLLNVSDEERSLPKRSLSLSPERKDSEIYKKQFFSSKNCLKKFKSESSVDNDMIKYKIRKRIRESVANICGDGFIPKSKNIINDINSGIENTYSKLSGSPDNSTLHKIDAKIFEDTVSIENSDDSSLNKMITSQSQNLDEIVSNYSYSESSTRSINIDKIHRIDAIDEIDCNSKNVEFTNEAAELDSLKTISSGFTDSTIDEIYYIDNADDIGCSISTKAINEMPVVKETERNKNDLESERLSVTSRKVVDDIESELLCLTKIQLKKIETEDKITENTVPNSAKNLEFKKEGVSKAPDDSSVLEISLESEFEQVLKQDRIFERGKTGTVVHVTDNLKTHPPNFGNVSKENTERINIPIDLTILNVKNSNIENVMPSKDVGAKNVGMTILKDDIETQLCIQSDDIARQNEMLMDKMTSFNPTISPAANVNSKKDPNTSRVYSEAFKDDLGLEFLSESELQNIEEEAYMKTKKETNVFDLKNVNGKNVLDGQDVFYRPERSNMITDDLVIPNWVTNPAREPNYDKMKRSVHMRREYIKKMLEEILRLSTIVSKVRSVIHAGDGNGDTEATLNGNLRIKERRETPPIKNTPNYQTDKSDIRDSEIFYVPHSNAPSNTALPAAACTATINTNSVSRDAKKSGNFYEPLSNRSNYDVPSVFNRSIDGEFKRDNFSSSYMQSSASNIFGSLKRDFDAHRSCETDSSIAGYQNKKLYSNGISKNSSNATVSVKDKTLVNADKVEPVNRNDTIFYLPDKFSSVSSNCSVLPSTKNSQTISSLNFTERPSAYVKSEVRNPLNIRQNLTPHTIRNDDSIFYNGNKGKGINF